MNLYIVRHGETNGNLERIMDGIRDIDINETGIKQAEEASVKLKGIEFDLIICSPLIRAKHTMEIINVNHYPVIYDKRIMERDCGEFTGKSFDSLDRKLYWNYYDNTQYEKAESVKSVFKRVYEFLDEIREKYKDQNILIVTHSGITRAIECYFNGIPSDGNLYAIGAKNCEVRSYLNVN